MESPFRLASVMSSLSQSSNETAVSRLKRAFVAGIWATLISIAIGFSFKVWLASWVPKADLAIYHTVIDIISLSLILMTGFRSSMVVSYSQTRNDRDIINIFRYVLILVVLLTWGIILPYIKHKLAIDVEYLQLVGIIVSMGLKVYFTNLVAMYRLYEISNKVTWMEPLSLVLAFALCYYGLSMAPLGALFYATTLSSLIIAAFMYLRRRRQIATAPLAKVNLEPALKSFMKRSVTASLEAGSSILMIYITVLLTIRYFSVEELGDFQVVVRPVFTYMTLLFVFPIYRFVLPELAVCVRSRDNEQIRAIKLWLYKLALIVSISFFVVMLLGGESLFRMLFPPQYHGAVPVLLHYAIFFIFLMLNGYQLAYIKAEGYFNASLLIRLAGIITLVGAFFLLRQLTANVVAVILALGCGYLMMYLIGALVERHIRHSKAQVSPAVS